MERKGKRNPEIQFICKTYRVALKHVHMEKKKIFVISGSRTETKLGEMADLGENAVELRREGLRTKAPNWDKEAEREGMFQTAMFAWV